MAPTTLLALSLLLLAAPWMMAPRAGRPTPEIHGPTLAIWWLNRLYCGIWHRLDLSETRALPETGPVLLVANHTCGIDHMLLQATTRRALGFMIAQEYYDVRFLRPFYRLVGCIPVRRDGRDLSATRAAMRTLEEGRVVPIFPEGRIVPTSGRELGEGKPGAAFIALRSGVPVIPAYIRGTPETNEIGRSLLTPSEARVVFGPPIDLSDLRREGRSERDAIPEATRRIMDAIRALQGGRDRPRAVAAPAGGAMRRPEAVAT